jgi:HSP20 family protein
MIPNLDFAETEEAFTVAAELPGLKEDDIRLELNNNLLTIWGEKKIEREDKKENYHMIERSSGTFRRTLQIPTAIAQDRIEATFSNGVLTITLPKAEEAKHKAKRIEIKSQS